MIKVKIPWHGLRQIAKESEENYKFLIECSREKLPTYEDMIADKGYCNFEAWINNIADLPDWMLKASSFEVVRPMKLLREDGLSSKNAAEIITTAQVHLPGNELLKIRKIFVLFDACTDSVQEELTKGSRIVAVCPQPSRRPDYIMGEM